MPLFLQQLVETLRREPSTTALHVTGPEPTLGPTEIGRAAAVHGASLLRRGYNVGQVVHNYGDVCQAVTDLAVELNEPITTDEFRTLNRCLDNAIADAVTAYAHGHDESVADKAKNVDRHDITLLDRQIQLINMAIQTFTAIQTGNVGSSGATGTVLSKALVELRNVTNYARPLLAPASETGTGPHR